MSRNSAESAQGRRIYPPTNKAADETLSYSATLDTARFWSKVERTDRCWLWRGAINPKSGYGRFSDKRRATKAGRMVPWPLYAHRVAWELTHGPIPKGQSVLHHCDVPNCVNPRHLFLGTQKTNMQDAQQKGRLHVSRPKSQQISDSAIADMKRLAAEGARQIDIARQFGVSKTFVCLLLKGRRRQHPKPRRKAVA